MKLLSQIKIKDKSEIGKLIKVAPFKQEIRKTKPHKHNNYFEIIYLSKGSGIHSIDRQTIQIQSPVIFFVRKEQVHHWNIESIPSGYVAIIKKGFVEKSIDGELRKLMAKLSRNASLKITEPSVIEAIFKLLTQEKNFTAKEGLLKALFAKIIEIAQPHILTFEHPNSLFQSFIELLSNTDGLKNKVAHYAELLNTTPQNLNHICRQSTGQSASEIIAEHIISEAKRLLFYTDNTVSEIALSLGFTDSSHFIKYFKRFTQETPQVFRKA